MKIKRFILIFFLLGFKLAVGQTYFDLYYTNIPKSDFSNYSFSNSKGLGWIQTGNYTSPSECSNCFDYSRDSKLKKNKLDTLVLLYKESGISKIYSKQYVSNNRYFATENKSSLPYIIKTLYRIESETPIPVHQIKMTFYDRQDKIPGILDIEILNEKTMRVFDSKLVLDSYLQKAKEDLMESAPPIQN